jgi:hypothetical protein
MLAARRDVRIFKSSKRHCNAIVVLDEGQRWTPEGRDDDEGLSGDRYRQAVVDYTRGFVSLCFPGSRRARREFTALDCLFPAGAAMRRRTCTRALAAPPSRETAWVGRRSARLQ